jgi:hypothetical protein
MKTLISLLMCLTAGLAAQDTEPETFSYDGTALRDPMSRQAPVEAAESQQDTSEQAQVASRLEDIQRVIGASRIEGIAVGPIGRFVIINDRVVAEGEPISAEYDVRVSKIEPDRVTFTLDTQALTYILTPPEEETLP